MTTSVDIRQGDCRTLLRAMPDASVHCCVTSPPYYGLRDYGHADQMGLEETPEAYIANMVAVFREVRRVLRDDGTLWLNIGDTYAANRSYQVNSTKGGPKHGPGQAVNGRGSTVPEGLKEKDLIGIPWMLAFALRADGWYLRQDIVWHKPNVMPESVRDRCTKCHEYLFLLTKSSRYHFDHEALKEPALTRPRTREKGNGESAVDAKIRGHGNYCGTSEMRNRRSVWTINTKPFKGAHFATFPEALAEPCILAGCPVGGTVLDPFGGSGTTGAVARQHGRNAILTELNPEYVAIARRRVFGEEPAPFVFPTAPKVRLPWEVTVP